jgi:hypothetical protein
VHNVSRQENRRLLTPAFILSATYTELNCIEVATQVLARGMNRPLDSICKLLQGYQATGATTDIANLSNTLPYQARISTVMIANLVAKFNGRLLPKNLIQTGTIKIRSGPMPKKLPNDSDDVDFFDNFKVSQARTGLFDAEHPFHEIPRLREASYKDGKALTLALSSTCRWSNGLDRVTLWYTWNELKSSR